MKYISKFMNELGKQHKIINDYILYKEFKIFVEADSIKVFNGDRLVKIYKTTQGFLNYFCKNN